MAVISGSTALDVCITDMSISGFRSCMVVINGAIIGTTYGYPAAATGFRKP